MKTAAAVSFAKLPKSYADLVAFHPPRVIRDKADYENTVAVIDAMAGHKLTPDQDDYLELLGQIVEAYEAETVSNPKPASPSQVLRFLLREHGLTGEDLAKVLGVDRSQAYRILKGARALTVEHIRNLSAKFAVEPALFLG